MHCVQFTDLIVYVVVSFSTLGYSDPDSDMLMTCAVAPSLDCRPQTYSKVAQKKKNSKVLRSYAKLTVTYTLNLTTPLTRMYLLTRIH